MPTAAIIDYVLLGKWNTPKTAVLGICGQKLIAIVSHLSVWSPISTASLLLCPSKIPAFKLVLKKTCLGKILKLLSYSSSMHTGKGKSSDFPTPGTNACM